MRRILTKIPVVLAVLALSASTFGQTRILDLGEYLDGLGDSNRRTNLRFPSVFKETWETFEKGKPGTSVTKVIERESQQKQRSTITIVERGRRSVVQKIQLSFDNIFCSYDGKTWIGPWMYDCRQPDPPAALSQLPTSTEFSVDKKMLDGKEVNAFRKFLVFKEQSREFYTEEIRVIEPDGLWISITETRGDLAPISVTFKRVQSWGPDPKFGPIIAPPNPRPWSGD